MDQNTWWTMIGGLGQVASAVVILSTVPFLIWQVVELRKATAASAYVAAIAWLQDELSRTARASIYAFKEKEPERWKDIKSWTPEERQAAERVCHTSDLLAVMARYGMLPKTVALATWNRALLNAWEATVPLIDDRRKNENTPELWWTFQWFAFEAEESLRYQRGWLHNNILALRPGGRLVRS